MAMESSNPNAPRTIKASEFKAKCLKLMDEVAETGEEIVITKNGRPTARLVALPGKTQESLRRRLSEVSLHQRGERSP